MFKKEYVTGKVSSWIKDIHALSEFAAEQPQAALCAFNSGVSQRWRYLQRTVTGLKTLLQPLEDAIRNVFIPAICEKEVSDLERQVLALPYRYGGLGILDPAANAQFEYDSSIYITEPLTSLINSQDMNMENLDRVLISSRKKEVKKQKEERIKLERARIEQALDEKSKRLLEAASEKGAWS